MNKLNSPMSSLLSDAIVSSSVVSARQNWLARGFKDVSTKVQKIRAYRTLSSFSDRELADIGLTRGMIREAVWGGEQN